MGKKTVTMYIDEDLIAECRKRNINMSASTSRILRMMLDAGESFTDEELRFELVKDRHDTLTKKIEEQQAAVRSDQSILEGIDRQMAELLPTIAQIRKSRQVAAIMKIINYEIEVSQYELDVAWERIQPQIEELKTLDHPIDKAWLEKRIERMYLSASVGGSMVVHK